MPKLDTDVIVVGGGAAGLSAARELCLNGRSVTLLEARSRLGGRIMTRHDPMSPLPIEYGAEFIHGEAEATFEIIDAARLLTLEIPDRHYWSENGRLEVRDDFWDELNAVRRKIKPGRRDRSFGEFLRAHRSIDADLKELVLNFVENYHAADVERVSATFLAAGDEETKGATRQFRLAAGYDALIEWLRSGVDPQRSSIRSATVVKTIAWRDGEVTAHVESTAGDPLPDVRARAAIVTVPLGVLKGGAITFSPPLPARKREAISLLEMGHVVKIVFRFRKRFWDDEAFLRERLSKSEEDPRAVFFHSLDPLVPTWWSASPAVGPTLTAWAGGGAADRLLSMSETEMIGGALDALSRTLALSRRKIDPLVESWDWHDWAHDPFSRGAYSYVLVGGARAQKELAAPLENCLFFAGEATDAEQTGTVAGALASGRRAARELIRSARRTRS